jgi:hypothetical protein
MRGVAEASQMRTMCGTSEAGGACDDTAHARQRHILRLNAGPALHAPGHAQLLAVIEYH